MGWYYVFEEDDGKHKLEVWTEAESPGKILLRISTKEKEIGPTITIPWRVWNQIVAMLEAVEEE